MITHRMTKKKLAKCARPLRIQCRSTVRARIAKAPVESAFTALWHARERADNIRWTRKNNEKVLSLASQKPELFFVATRQHLVILWPLGFAQMARCYLKDPTIFLAGKFILSLFPWRTFSKKIRKFWFSMRYPGNEIFNENSSINNLLSNNPIESKYK